MKMTNALRRIYALFVARNLEFFRDRAALSWSILLPVLLIIGFAYAFGNDDPDKFTVGYMTIDQPSAASDEFLQTRFIRFVETDNLQDGQRKIERHQLDLLLDANARRYWINSTSPNGYIVEKLLTAAYASSPQSLERTLLEGEEIRYIDWVVPGILGMNIMWGALFGIGYVIVRYRKMGVLKRLRATPVSALEFLTAQILSRLWLLVALTSVIFFAMDWVVDFRMHGSYLNLLLVLVLGSICLVCCGLVVAARISSEEVANGVLNLFSWPMMFLSGVWFSLEGAHPLMQQLAYFLPLTHITEAARAVMIDGADLIAISDHLLILAVSSIILLLIGARIFRWE
ncbi:MAG: ABC transporter permease [Pseudomonadota bacterium]